MSEQEISYTYMANEAGNYIIFKPDGDTINPQRLCGYLNTLEQRVEGLEEALEKITQWSEAYPLSVFPEPDFEKAQKLLKDGGMTLDAISASNMRHVVKGVGKIAQEALAAEESRRER